MSAVIKHGHCFADMFDEVWTGRALFFMSHNTHEAVGTRPVYFRPGDSLALWRHDPSVEPEIRYTGTTIRQLRVTRVYAWQGVPGISRDYSCVGFAHDAGVRISGVHGGVFSSLVDTRPVVAIRALNGPYVLLTGEEQEQAEDQTTSRRVVLRNIREMELPPLGRELAGVLREIGVPVAKGSRHRSSAQRALRKMLNEFLVGTQTMDGNYVITCVLVGIRGVKSGYAAIGFRRHNEVEVVPWRPR